MPSLQSCKMNRAGALRSLAGGLHRISQNHDMIAYYCSRSCPPAAIISMPGGVLTPFTQAGSKEIVEFRNVLDFFDRGFQVILHATELHMVVFQDHV